MRRDTVAMSNRKPKYIILLKDLKGNLAHPTNFSSATFACDLEEVSAMSKEYNSPYYCLKILACDYSMRGDLKP